eukprot:TRINITY_DN6217_c0_g1_i1.p1 TRINITY_DN6217_c0_g1~~TRINITY_DN6217_c0_g1_i1.p1  ORF type:complete len:454 (-),score=90.66 TRINITY_DN6217_c0_g1_i1:159-1520(-)
MLFRPISHLTHLVRSYSQSTPVSPDLNSVFEKGLKRFLLLVHPDSFTRNESLKKHNEESYKHIMMLLNATASNPVEERPLSFFLRSDQEDGGMSSTVESTIPAYATELQIKREIFSMFMKSGAVKLEDNPFDLVAGKSVVSIPRFIEFVKGVSDIAKQRYHTIKELDQELGSIHSSLFFQKSIRVLFPPDQSGNFFPLQIQIDVLRQLTPAFEQYAQSGLSFVVGKEREDSLDCRGRVVIPLDKSDLWIPTLQNIDLGKISKKKELFENEMQRENSAAAIIGVKFLTCCSEELTMTHEYSLFLGRIFLQQDMFKKYTNPSWKNLSLVVQGHDQKTRIDVSETFAITVNIRCTPEEILAFMLVQADKISLNQRRDDRIQIMSMRLHQQVKRKCQLPELRRDARTVSVLNFNRCCRVLTDNYIRLMPISQHAFKVSDMLSLDNDGLIKIPWSLTE